MPRDKKFPFQSLGGRMTSEPSPKLQHHIHVKRLASNFPKHTGFLDPTIRCSARNRRVEIDFDYKRNFSPEKEITSFVSIQPISQSMVVSCSNHISLDLVLNIGRSCFLGA
jgi:hypothetical protein